MTVFFPAAQTSCVFLSAHIFAACCELEKWRRSYRKNLITLS